jgi:hypothetical protein
LRFVFVHYKRFDVITPDPEYGPQGAIEPEKPIRKREILKIQWGNKQGLQIHAIWQRSP